MKPANTGLLHGKAQGPRVHFARGKFRYVKIDKPDYGTDEYPKPDGEYSIQQILTLDDPATQAFLAKLQPLHAEAVARAEEKFKQLKIDVRKKLGSVKVNDLFTTVYDPDTEEPTGEIVFKFARPASYKEKDKRTGEETKKQGRPPVLFDAKGQPIKKPMQIWGGSVGRINFAVGIDRDTGDPGYFIQGTGAAGLKLRLNAVQIIELVQGGDRSASGYGFGTEEGYEHGADGFVDETDGDSSTDASSDDGSADF